MGGRTAHASHPADGKVWPPVVNLRTQQYINGLRIKKIYESIIQYLYQLKPFFLRLEASLRMDLWGYLSNTIRGYNYLINKFDTNQWIGEYTLYNSIRMKRGSYVCGLQIQHLQLKPCFFPGSRGCDNTVSWLGNLIRSSLAPHC